MPELPEVETIARQLSMELVRGEKLHAIRLHRSDLRFPFPADLSKRLVGCRLQSIWRRGKYLIFEFDRGYLLSHLGMSGSWRVVRGSILGEAQQSQASRLQLNRAHVQPPATRPHDHVELYFAGQNSSTCLVYNDPRRFGYLEWQNDLCESRFLRELGPEPFAAEFDGLYLFGSTRKRTSSIKAHLMNASVVVGIGNIYASEILFRAGVRPTWQAKSIRIREAEKLVASTQVVLAEAIEAGGSTIRDYVSSDGRQGEFQQSHFVYGREGLLCRECHTSVIRMKVISGRSTFWCAHCQK